MFEILKEYDKKNTARFHTPGHSGCDIGINTSMDITELSFSGNLLSSSSIIGDVEKKLAKTYNSHFALMLTCGATSAIATALAVAKEKYNDIIIIEGAHQSAYNYAKLWGFNIINANLNEYNRFTHVKTAVLLTTPDYFGNIHSITGWLSPNKLIITDEAHGAHFPFSDRFPKNNVGVADIVITSLHKTLPVLTGGAALFTNDSYLYDRLFALRAMIHTTSPNYMIMASIDKALSQTNCDMYEKVYNSVIKFKNSLNGRFYVKENDDFSRLVIELNGLSGAEYQKLLENRGVYIEMSYFDQLLAIVTPFNHQHLNLVAKTLNSSNIDILAKKLPKLDLINSKITDREIVYMEIGLCENKIIMQDIGYYPPGVAIIKSGDVLSKNAIEFIEKNITSLFGIRENKIAVAK